jgi:hypothetical protein
MSVLPSFLALFGRFVRRSLTVLTSSELALVTPPLPPIEGTVEPAGAAGKGEARVPADIDDVDEDRDRVRGTLVVMTGRKAAFALEASGSAGGLPFSDPAPAPLPEVVGALAVVVVVLLLAALMGASESS